LWTAALNLKVYPESTGLSGNANFTSVSGCVNNYQPKSSRLTASDGVTAQFSV